MYETLTIADLKKHAEKFGVEGVAETAVEQGISVAALAALLEDLDEIHDRWLRQRKRFVTKKKRRGGYYERAAKRMLGITEEEGDE